jgi:hypothetical protein
MICPTGIAKYFLRYDWTRQIRLNRLKKIVFPRTRSRLSLAAQAGRHSQESQLICPSGSPRRANIRCGLIEEY